MGLDSTLMKIVLQKKKSYETISQLICKYENFWAHMG